jgi:hypothetical protein
MIENFFKILIIISLFTACKKQNVERPDFITLGSFDKATMVRNTIDCTLTRTDLGTFKSYSIDFNNDAEADIVINFTAYDGPQVFNKEINIDLNQSAVLTTLTARINRWNDEIDSSLIQIARLSEVNTVIKKDTLWFSNNRIKLFYYHLCTDCAGVSETKFGANKIDEMYLPIMFTHVGAVRLGWVKLSYDLTHSSNQAFTIHEYCIQK